ncbi:hypothetical protein C0584_06160 [Candidatus Parcubacteria bacterium]|nr:MAG: hypothetical protein C0584_06160 [Candidatus Parcubacteria bacterium]
MFSLFLLSANTANAYLDAGTGSYVLQLVLGGILGGLFILKSYFRKIIFLFRKIITKKEKKSNE